MAFQDNLGSLGINNKFTTHEGSPDLHSSTIILLFIQMMVDSYILWLKYYDKIW